MLLLRCFVVILPLFAHFSAFPRSAIRFFDSSTGHRIAPEELQLGASNGIVTVQNPTYRTFAFPKPASATVEATVWLEPLAPPAELDPARIRSLHQRDAMLLLGFVTDESGTALNHVRVAAGLSETRSDARGYFELFVLLRETVQGHTTLTFQRDGFSTQEIQSVQCWPNGDLTHLIRLKKGDGREVVDENFNRRLRWGAEPTAAPQPQYPEAASAQSPAQSSSNLTVRVPGTIRVLRSNVIDYVSLELYCRRSLVREWIASWSGYTGGMDSLKAGAVAVRTYAIGYVHSPRDDTYDICATTSCQVYGLTTSSSTDTAVNQTAGAVMISSGGTIPRGLTEYSSENNSIGFACGDGFTAPTGGCISDPVCTGEPRFGHGRGMCQWGSVKWATGLRFPSNDFSDTTSTNGFPRRDWVWILQHYYPTLRLVQGTPLVVGDEIKVLGTNALIVRMCADGGITNGADCNAIGTKPSQATGSIIAGPDQILTDGFGFRWWKVEWSDGMVGWSPENWLQRMIPLPTAPTNLTATPTSPTQVSLSWSNTSALDQGFKIELATAAGGPWLVVTQANTNVTVATVGNLQPDTAYYFRVRAFNIGGDSPPSNVATVGTPTNAPELVPVPDQTVDENTSLTVAMTTIGSEHFVSITDFENFAANASGGNVLFRQPRFSGSTSALLEPTPDVSVVTDNFPPSSGARALAVRCSFTNTAAPWLRLTTFNPASLPNPVIDLTARLRFDVHTDRDVLMGLGVRESTNSVGDPIGSNGGTMGGIEWVGVTNRSSGVPTPSRRITPGAWQTVNFDFGSESVTNFSGGNSQLSTASGLAVLEHLAIVPATGTGVHNIYLDNFAVAYRRELAYSLDSAPSLATIDPNSGAFSWTPTEAHGPGSYPVTVRVIADGDPLLADTDTFVITVREVNRAPVLAALGNRTIHAGTTLLLTNVATDPDVPTNSLAFSLLPPLIPGALINAGTGEFVFTSSLPQANTTNQFRVRVQDNGSPTLSATNTFTVSVLPPPSVNAAIVAGEMQLRWSAIPGQRYRIQFKNDLGEVSWTDIGPTLTAAGPELEFTDNTGAPRRFYHIQVE